jgi:hypothetical protein
MTHIQQTEEVGFCTCIFRYNLAKVVYFELLNEAFNAKEFIKKFS